MKSENGKQPDLILYYRNENNKNIPISKNWSNYIISGTIFNNFTQNIPIGKFRINGSQSFENLDTFFNEYFVAQLPEGEITWFASGINKTNNSGKFNDNQVIISRIVNGSKDFSYVKGIVYNNVLKNPERIAYIYFTD